MTASTEVLKTLRRAKDSLTVLGDHITALEQTGGRKHGH